MKKGKIIGTLIITACMLTGCIDHMPDMTEEQSELVAEYAANLLLKYSPNYNYRIADEEELAQAETETEEVSTQVQTEETLTEQPVGDENDSDKAEEGTSQETKTDSEEGIENGDEFDLAGLFDLENLTVRYQSYEIVDSYPEAGQGSAFSVTAPQGHNLLILHFDVENTGSDAEECDLFDKISRIRVNVNDTGYAEALNTLLTNDFGTYMEEIPAGEIKDVVIAAAVEQGDSEEIDSIKIRIITENSTTNISLK